MELILETKPPFVVKVYDNYFHISWDGFSDNSEDKFFYEKIKSVRINKGRFSSKRELFGLIVESLTDTGGTVDNAEPAELVIEFKTGQIEKRYLHEISSDKIKPAIELINRKLQDFS